MKHRENGLANGIIRPRYVSCNFLVSIGVVDNGRRKEPVRVIPRRNRTVHRNGSSACRAGHPGQHRKREHCDRNYCRDSQQAAAKPTHGYHLDLDRDGDEYASMSQQNTASKHQLNTS